MRGLGYKMSKKGLGDVGVKCQRWSQGAGEINVKGGVRWHGFKLSEVESRVKV